MRKTEWLLALVVLAVSLAVAWSLPTNVRAQGVKFYRVIDENNGSKIEQQLNELVRQDSTCRPILTMSQSDYGKSKVILECGP